MFYVLCARYLYIPVVLGQIVPFRRAAAGPELVEGDGLRAAAVRLDAAPRVLLLQGPRHRLLRVRMRLVQAVRRAAEGAPVALPAGLPAAGQWCKRTAPPRVREGGAALLQERLRVRSLRSSVARPCSMATMSLASVKFI